MVPSPFSLLIIRRFSLSLNPKCHHLLQPFLGICARNSHSFSTSAPQQNPNLEPTTKPSSLSARLSFVFDQIDAIEKKHSEQDETLERIRAWRQSKQTQHDAAAAPQNPDRESRGSSGIDADSRAAELVNPESVELRKEKGVVELVHPWPEWMELMERLVQQNYFDHRRRDEDNMVQSLGMDLSIVGEGGDDDVGIALQDFKTVHTACINFGKDRFDILRSLSRHDIQILVGHGCPATDRKVVFSGKLLRKRVHLDEGDVCSSCSLRNSCEKAFLLTNKEDEARTVDVMRILFTYGFDPLNGSVANKDLLKQKSVKTVVRKLLHEVVKLSAVPIDPNLPPPVIKKPPPKVKQPPPPPKKRVGRDDVEMKKGDWLCPKCDFMNFAKNTVCLQCDAKRPKRQLLPGEWECPECNFLNYRRNMTCFHCDCKRPADEFIENKMQEKQRGMGTGTEKAVKRNDVSNAWNFDFDDDESDGADVAAFEYADSTLRDKTPPFDDAWAPRDGFRDPEDEVDRHRGAQGFSQRESPDLGRHSKPSIGFDDFDDEDDIDSYEIDNERDRDVPKASTSSSSYTFSHDDGFSDSETDDIHAHRGSSAKLRKNNSQSNARKSRAAFSDDDDELGFDTDDEVSVTPKWKSSHVASAHKNRRGGSPKKLSFGSDEEFGLESDMENSDPDENFKGRQRNSGRKGVFKSKRSSFSASEFADDNEDYNSVANRTRGSRKEARGFKFDRPSSRGKTHGNDRRFHESNKNSQRGNSRNLRGFENRSQNNDRDRDRDRDYGEFRNSRRVIER